LILLDNSDDEVSGLDVDEGDVEELCDGREGEDEQEPEEPEGIGFAHQNANLKANLRSRTFYQTTTALFYSPNKT